LRTHVQNQIFSFSKFSLLFFSLPDYDKSTLKNDISLLMTSQTVALSNYVQPVALPTQGIDVLVNISCWITGWGSIAGKRL